MGDRQIGMASAVMWTLNWSIEVTMKVKLPIYRLIYVLSK